MGGGRRGGRGGGSENNNILYCDNLAHEMGETFKSVRTCKQRFIDEYKDHVMPCDKDVLSISSFKSKFA